ncbi:MULTISPECIES: peptidoglycan-binding protein [Actinomyces]|uniref:Peptidoglycan-binding protein n=1 Tax=Actinomyces respiraculi TaxID=2744574 RepID=A0A7T0LLE5_9ACTO|nr:MULTISPECIES: peptidoglycan-binding protein [Actinomyces]QPL05591.1 peptidoglycan-binding protein [Actinomyces respiraculi]
MNTTTISTQGDDASTGSEAELGGARRTRRRTFLTLGTVAVLAAGAGAGTFATKTGPFAPEPTPTATAFTGATDTITRGDLKGETSVTGTLRYADPHKLKSSFDGVLVQVPSSGTVLTHGDVIYSTGSEYAYLMHGAIPAWRSFEAGMENGEDIRQLETILRGMGYFDYEPDNRFTWYTTNAIMKWQKAVGLAQTGTIPLGRMVFVPGDLRVGTVSARLGDQIGAGSEICDVTSTTQVVESNVKLSDQRLAVVGTAVTITLPDATSTTGTISEVGTPIEKKSSESGSGSDSGGSETKERVIPITVTLDDTSATASFQEVSVTVALPSETREDVLSVPVGALLALTPDQFGVEIVESDGTTRKVPVTIGLFAGGRVEVSGDDIAEGDRVVVPQT